MNFENIIIEYPCLLKFITDSTPELYLKIIKINGSNIKYIKNPTQEICLMSIKQDGNNLKYMTEQPPEICLEAIKNNINAIKFINLPFSYEFVKTIKKENDISDNIKKFIKKYCMEKKPNSQIIYIDIIENITELIESNDIKNFICNKFKFRNDDIKLKKFCNSQEILRDSLDKIAYIKKNDRYIVYRKENTIIDINNKYQVTQTTLKKIGLCFKYMHCKS